MKIKNIAKRAFTLIEIMVATVIMVVLVGLVIQITSEVLKVWTRSSGKLAANAEARIAMDMITQDLETAVFRNNRQQWLRVDGPEAMAASAPYTSHTVALKLFSPALDRDTSSAGDICGIAYRLEYQESYDQTGVTNPVEVYALYRAIARPDDTFNLLMGSASQGTSSPQDSIDGTPAFWTAASILSPDNYLVSNIVDFKVLVYEDDGSMPPVPANADPTTFKLIAGQDYIYGGTGGTNTHLLYADVILTVVSDAGLEILSLPSLAGTGYDDADDVVREYGEVFTRRVNFMARPL